MTRSALHAADAGERRREQAPEAVLPLHVYRFRLRTLGPVEFTTFPGSCAARRPGR
jgi:hypothetical protein